MGGHASRDGACCGDAFLLVISRTLCRLLCSKPIFSPSYIAARHRFREAAVAARARIHAYEIGEIGADWRTSVARGCDARCERTCARVTTYLWSSRS